MWQTMLNSSSQRTTEWSSLSTKKWTHRNHATMRFRCPSHFRWVASTSFRTVVQLPNISRWTKNRKQRWLIVTNAGFLYHRTIPFQFHFKWFGFIPASLPLCEVHCFMSRPCITGLHDVSSFQAFVITVTGLDFLRRRLRGPVVTALA
jgi:hypothetical protein